MMNNCEAENMAEHLVAERKAMSVCLDQMGGGVDFLTCFVQHTARDINSHVFGVHVLLSEKFPQKARPTSNVNYS